MKLRYVQKDIDLVLDSLERLNRQRIKERREQELIDCEITENAANNEVAELIRKIETI